MVSMIFLGIIWSRLKDGLVVLRSYDMEQYWNDVKWSNAKLVEMRGKEREERRSGVEWRVLEWKKSDLKWNDDCHIHQWREWAIKRLPLPLTHRSKSYRSASTASSLFMCYTSILFYPLLCCVVLCCFVLFRAILPCPALPCPALPCPALPCPAMPCPNYPSYPISHCPLLSHTHCTVLNCTALHYRRKKRKRGKAGLVSRESRKQLGAIRGGGGTARHQIK